MLKARVRVFWAQGPQPAYSEFLRELQKNTPASRAELNACPSTGLSGWANKARAGFPFPLAELSHMETQTGKSRHMLWNYQKATIACKCDQLGVIIYITESFIIS